MDPDPWLAGTLGFGALLVLFTAALSGLETVVLNARRSRLPNAPPKRRALAEAIIDAPEHFQTSAHLAKSLCEALLYPTGALLGIEAQLRAQGDQLTLTVPVAAHLLGKIWPGVLAGGLFTYVVVTLIGESLPKIMAARDPERLLLRHAKGIRTIALAMTPVRWAAGVSGRALARGAGCDPSATARAAHSEQEIMLLVEGSAEEGMLEEEEKEMISSIFEFTDTVARQIMVPRTEIYSVSVEAPLSEVVHEALESGHSRLPVYRDTQDEIVGVVHAKDLLRCLAADRDATPLSEIMRPPFFVPEGKKIDELLQEFRDHKSQMAIVVDQFGGTSGLVTIEDVLEEIVGEIHDEYDEVEEPYMESTPSGEGTLVDGRTTLDEINEELELSLPDEDHDTVGGFVFGLFGRPPAAGERVEFGQTDFIVEAMEGLRISKIRIVTRAPQEPEPETAAP